MMLMSSVGVQGLITGVTASVIFRNFEPQDSWPHLALHGGAGLATFVWFPFLDALTAISTYFIGLCLSMFFYRGFINPLRKFPGEFGAHFTQLWLARVSLSGQRHKKLCELHKKYGDFVRTGPNAMSISTSAAVIPILGPNGWDKGPSYDAMMDPPNARSLFSTHAGPEYQHRRKLWDQGLSAKALQSYEPFLRSRMQQLIEIIGDDMKNDTLLNIGSYLSYFTFDFMGDLAFGGAFEMMRDRDGTYQEILSEGVPVMYTFGTMPWLARDLRRLPTGGKAKQFIDFAERSYKARRARGSGLVDLFSWLLGEHSSHPSNLSDADLAADSVLAIGAGSDTSSTAMRYVLAYLFSPEYKPFLDRVRKEIDQVAADTGLEDLDKLGQLTFFNAVINEALRIAPPIPNGNQRRSPSGGAMIGDTFIPEGTNVYIHTWSIHHDPRYYPEPYEFKPERFIDNKITAEIFMPFGFGPFMCVGRRLAFMMMRIALSNIIYNYDLELEKGFSMENFEKQNADYFLLVPGPLKVTVHKRADKS